MTDDITRGCSQLYTLDEQITALHSIAAQRLRKTQWSLRGKSEPAQARILDEFRRDQGPLYSATATLVLLRDAAPASAGAAA